MPTLFVRGVPDELYARLRQAAAESRRSINAAAIEALERGLATSSRGRLALDQALARAAQIRQRSTPLDQPASAVDLIREDRER